VDPIKIKPTLMKLPKFYHRKQSKWKMLTKHFSGNFSGHFSWHFSGHFLFWTAFLFFSVMFLVLIRKNDIKIPQREIVLKVDIKDKINICLPDEHNKKR